MYPVEPAGARVVLRELSPSMSHRIWPLVRAEEGVFGPMGFAETEHELRQWLAREEEHARSDDRMRYRWVVELRETDEPIGTARVYIENVFERQASLGYALTSPHRGKGLAREAVALALGHAFDTLKLHRVWATIEPDNHRSIRFAERLGMRREGFLQARIRVGEDWRDAYLYAITENEWRAR